MIEPITVRELKETLSDAIRNGLGNKKILIAVDDEGNFFRKMYCDLTTTDGFQKCDAFDLTKNENIEDFIILG